MATLEIRIQGANCPYCLNETMDRLRAEPGVASVRASMADGCLVVEHRDVAEARLVAIVGDNLHGSARSSNEIVMVQIDAEVAELHCAHR